MGQRFSKFDKDKDKGPAKSWADRGKYFTALGKNKFIDYLFKNEFMNVNSEYLN